MELFLNPGSLAVGWSFDVGVSSPADGCDAAEIGSPPLSISARSITFFSPRTFPGKVYASRSCIASGVTDGASHAHLVGEELQKMADQEREIMKPVPEGRRFDRHTGRRRK